MALRIAVVIPLMHLILLSGCAGRQIVRDDPPEPEYAQAWRQVSPPKPAEDSKVVKALKIGGWVGLGAVVIAGAIVAGSIAHTLATYG